MEMISKKVISKWKSFTYHMTFLKRSWKEIISKTYEIIFVALLEMISGKFDG